MYPFYVKDQGFVNASELFIGDKLLDPNGKVLLVEDIKFETTTEPTTVYNFQVEDFHTYYVGWSGVLVHNAGMDYNQDQLLKAGNQPDKGDLTKSGRAAQKHGSREGSKFPEIKGNPDNINTQGNNILKTILNDPDATAVTRHHARYGEVLEIKLPNGCGARFSSDGNTFIGFIE